MCRGADEWRYLVPHQRACRAGDLGVEGCQPVGDELGVVF
jgi:hypothetical protein